MRYIVGFVPKKKKPVLFQVPVWWGKVDSNHRRHCQQIYSLSPLATREFPHIQFALGGAGGRTRTPDLLITNQLLYRLSYTSILPASPVYRSNILTPERLVIIANRIGFVNHYFLKAEKYCKFGFFSPACTVRLSIIPLLLPMHPLLE